MFSTRFLWSALVLVASCTGTFGLDPVSVDDDLDGLLDDADNCPQTYNPMQQDFDRDGTGDHCGVCAAPSARDDDFDGIDDACDACVGPGEVGSDVGDDGIDDGCEPCPAATGQDLDTDGVDDACDSCLRGPPLDEDGDSVANACDNCPSRPNPLQEHINDEDRVGDACDPDTDSLGASGLTAAQTPRMFDPFVGSPGSWAYLAAPTSDGIAHLTAGDHGEASAKLSDELLIETTVRFPTPTADATFVVELDGTALVTPAGCQFQCEASFTCTLTGDGHLALKTLYDNVTTSIDVLDVSAPIMLWVRSSTSTRSTSGTLSQLCVGVDIHGTVVSTREDDIAIPTKEMRYTAFFRAGPQPVDLHYVWLVSN